MSGRKIAGIIVLVVGLLTIVFPMMSSDTFTHAYEGIETFVYLVGVIVAITGVVILVIPKSQENVSSPANSPHASSSSSTPRKDTIKTVAAIVIGAVLMFAVQHFASDIPFDTGVEGTYLNLGIAILAVFAAIFGPIAGFLIGFIGHTLVDAFAPWGISWSWIASSAIFGYATGFFWKSYRIEEGEFGLKECLSFNGIQIAANVLVWVFVARTLDMIIYNESFAKVSPQSFAAAGYNSAVVLVLSSLLAFGYSRFRGRR
jgi:energy-coupling factor transport system substrate-specific component